MIIETYDKVYSVVQHRVTGLHKDIYICKNKEDGQLYTIIRIKDKKNTAKIVEFICEQKRNAKFSDFVEYFAYKEDLHIVFQYIRGMELERRLKQVCTLEERMEIGKKLLEKLVLFQLPPYFLCQCLELNNIFVTDSLEVNFDYTLDKVEEYEIYTNRQAEAYLYRVIYILFAKELKKNVIEPMDKFLKKIQTDENFECLQIYKSYCECCDRIRKIPDEELAVSKNWFYRFWEKVKSFHKVIKGSLLLLIFFGVFLYMIYSIWCSFQIKGYQKNYNSIGTVEIGDDGIEEQK